MRSVMFDLDGTLADTSGDLVSAANATFAEMGLAIRLDPVADAAVAMRGGRSMLELGFTRAGRDVSDAILTEAYPELLRHYARDISSHSYLYPGAMDAVSELSAMGYIVGICTNKPEGLADSLLQALGVRDAFASLVGGDTLAVRKPDPEHLVETVRRAGGDPTRTCLVGDTDADHGAALAAGVPSLLVTFGPGAQAVRRLTPAHFIDHYAQLPAQVAALDL